MIRWMEDFLLPIVISTVLGWSETTLACAVLFMLSSLRLELLSDFLAVASRSPFLIAYQMSSRVLSLLVRPSERHLLGLLLAAGVTQETTSDAFRFAAPIAALTLLNAGLACLPKKHRSSKTWGLGLAVAVVGTLIVMGDFGETMQWVSATARLTAHDALVALGVAVSGLTLTAVLGGGGPSGRKVFHGLLIAVSLLSSPSGLRAGASLGIVVLLAIESLRQCISNVWLDKFWDRYLDEKDQQGFPIAITPLLLLVGCTGTTLVSFDAPFNCAFHYAGLATLGVGDAAAAIVGRRWGRNCWVQTGDKTIEGSVALALTSFFFLTAICGSQWRLHLLLSVVAAGLEALLVNDNLLLATAATSVAKLLI